VKRTLSTVISILAIALVASACSGSGTPATTAAPTTTSVPTTTTPGEGAFEVVMESFAFTPAELTVPVGATVTWINRHSARHDVVAADRTFASPLFGKDETFSFTFEAPGEYPYVCTIHPGMEGTIIVTP
jgi:plastocyanin